MRKFMNGIVVLTYVKGEASFEEGHVIKNDMLENSFLLGYLERFYTFGFERYLSRCGLNPTQTVFYSTKIWNWASPYPTLIFLKFGRVNQIYCTSSSIVLRTLPKWSPFTELQPILIWDWHPHIKTFLTISWVKSREASFTKRDHNARYSQVEVFQKG